MCSRRVAAPLCVPRDDDDGAAFDAAVYPEGASTPLWPRPDGYLDRLEERRRAEREGRDGERE